MRSGGHSWSSRRDLRQFATALGIAALLGAVLQAAAQQRPEPVKNAYAVIGGTVFQENGLALRGAAVAVREDAEDGSTSRRKPLTATSDGRGEFAFRVPAIAMRYTVKVQVPGYVTQEKQVSISGEQRMDVYFKMERATSNK